ncbi:unnamed protein product [Clonostachys chloroleuca]|uniref:Uncharacterized protein n=1 Tax=Clonostachys chloroleuca TaxID=1926264 RepID=A0AA35MD93_9HYPO|nr:unnamed protein product [Clonostachys chloroleuca]
MTLTRVNGISLKDTPANKIDMAASAPLSTIVHEPLIKSNYEVVLGHDVTVLTQLDTPYWTVVVLSSTASSPVRTVVTTEKSLDLAAALAAVHRRSALEVSHFYVAMGKTYDSPIMPPLPGQKRKTKRDGSGLDNDGVRQPSEVKGGDDLDNENYTDSSSESEDDVELGLDLSDESEDEDGLQHIKKPSHRRRRETKNNMFEPRTVPSRQSTSPRMPPPAVGEQTATAPAGDGTIPVAVHPHFYYGQPGTLTGAGAYHSPHPPILGPHHPFPHQHVLLPHHHLPPHPPFPPQGHKPATVPNHPAAVLSPSMLGTYSSPTQRSGGQPINVFQQPKGSSMPPPPAAVPPQLRASNPPATAAGCPRRPAAPAALPSLPAPRPVSINIHWIGRGSLLVTDNCAPLHGRILERSMQLARLKSGEFGGVAPAADQHRMMALLKRVRAGDVVYEVTSRVDDLSPLLARMGPPSQVGFPCFDVEIVLQSGDGED